MNDLTISVALWLADFFLLSTVLLGSALVALAFSRQPAQRLAVTKSTLVALFLLAALCAAPGWSLIHLISHQPSQQLLPLEQPVLANREAVAFEPAAATLPAIAPPPTRSAAPVILHEITDSDALLWPNLNGQAILTGIYGIGVVCVLAWLSLGGLAARRLVRSATPAPAELTDLLAQLASDSPPHVRLLIAHNIDVAVAIGVRRPAILLPKSLVDTSSALHTPHSALRPILAHELTHITNHDLHWLAASRALLILLWPQPLYWLLRRRMRIDQEALADAAAAELTTRQSYAEQLVAWARALPPRPAPCLSAVVGLWEGPSQLRQRIALLVDEHFTVLRNCSQQWRRGAALAAVAVAAFLSLVTLEPGHSQPPADSEQLLSADDAEKVAAAIRLLRDTEGIGGQTSVKIQPVGRAHVADDWAAEVRTLTEIGRPAVPALIAALDEEQRDHPISKLAFTLRAIGDPRAVPALIRAIPRTLCPSRSDYGLRIEDPDLLRFMQQHDLTPADRRDSGFDYGRSFREVVGALHKLTGADQNDMELNWVHLAESPAQQALQRRLFQQLAERWVDWWSKNWQKLGVDETYADVKLPPSADAALAANEAPAALPVSSKIALVEQRSGWIVESAHESGKRCFVDLDTSREAGWPAELPPIDQIGADSEQVLAWAREQGFDLVGITYQPPGYNAPLYCLQPLEMTVWQLAPDELRDLPRAMKGEIEYPVHLPVERMMPRVAREDETGMPALSESAFIYLTREGTAGLLRMTAQVTDTNVQIGKPSSPDDEHSPVGFYRGAKISFATMAESDQPVPPPAANVAPRLQFALAAPVAVAPAAPPQPAGGALEVKNNPREAAAALTRILNRQPDDPTTLLRRSEAWQRLGEYKNAIADLEHVIRVNPPGAMNFVAHNNLAYLLAAAPDDSLRDGKRAVELALRARELADRDVPDILDTLAAAYAETGDFDLAVATLQEAVQEFPDAKQSFQEHLVLYQAGKPLRDTPHLAAGPNVAPAAPPRPNTIDGHAQDEHGRQLAGAEASLLRVNRQDYTRTLIARKTSDSGGNFRFDNVIDVPREFPDAKFPPFGELSGDVLELVVRAPGRVTQSHMVLLPDVARRGELAMVRMPPAATLRGRVTGPDGKPVAGALVVVGTSNFGRADRVQSARTDADGNYVINDAAPFDRKEFEKQQEAEQRQMEERRRRGEGAVYTLFRAPPVLTVEHPDFAVKKTDYDGIPGTKDVQLAPPATLAGRVVYAGTNQPAANVLVNATTSHPKTNSVRPTNPNDYHAVKARTDADGRYRFATLPAGNYDLWAETADWVNVGTGPVAAAADETTSVPDLVFTKGGLIHVRLVDAKTGEPMKLPAGAQASITAVPKTFFGARPMFYQSLDPLPDGAFEIRVLPGENQIFLAGVAVDSEYKWTGATMAGQQPPEAEVADGQTVTLDIPVVDINTAQANAGVYSVVAPPPRKPTESVAITAIHNCTAIGDRFLLCPVTTDGQRRLLGYVAEPAGDTALYVLVNYSAFKDEQLDPRSPAMLALSEQLARFAAKDNRYAKFRVLVGQYPGVPFDKTRDQAQALGKQCEALGRVAGFQRATSSTAFGGYNWNPFVAAADLAAREAKSNLEEVIGDERVKVLPVRTFLSRLETEADCVVDVIPKIRMTDGSRFPDDFIEAMLQFIPRLQYERNRKVLVRVRVVEAAQDELEKWISDRENRIAFAQQFGFQDCSVEQSLTDDGDDAPQTADITGQVQNPDGTPAAGVRVIAFTMQDADNISKGYGYRRTRTGDDGRFRLTLDSGGKEVFWILPDDYSQQTHIINDRRGDLGVFKLENGLHLHGRVVDKDGKPIPDIWVNAELRGGPAFHNIEMPVADNIERASLTDAGGRFDLGPLPPGTYEVCPDENREDDFEHRDPPRPLPAAFLPKLVELSAITELDELEIRPVESVTIEVRFLDSKGRPTHGNGFFLIGTMPDGKRLGLRRDQQGQEPVVFVAPKGLEKTIVDFPLSSMRVRRAPDQPWENDHSIDLGTLERDWREIEVVRFQAPTLVVAARDAAGNPIPDFKPAIFYHFRDKQEDRKGRWIGEVRGDVNFEPAADGRWQSEFLLPDEEFTLTVSADGYKPFEETMSLAEGENVNVEPGLQPAQ